MKRWRLLDWVLLACLLAGVLAPFMPWGHWSGKFDEQRVKDNLELFGETDRNYEVWDFLGTTREQWDMALRGFGSGVSGVRLFEALRSGDAAVSGPAQYFARPLTGADGGPGRAWWLWVPVAVLLAGCVAELWEPLRKRKLARFAGIVLLAAYAVLRWRLAEALNERLAAEMRVGMGLWLLAHALLIAGVALMVRSWLPKSKVW
jgi:hypothetical protein